MSLVANYTSGVLVAIYDLLLKNKISYANKGTYVSLGSAHIIILPAIGRIEFTVLPINADLQVLFPLIHRYIKLVVAWGHSIRKAARKCALRPVANIRFNVTLRDVYSTRVSTVKIFPVNLITVVAIHTPPVFMSHVFYVNYFHHWGLRGGWKNCGLGCVGSGFSRRCGCCGWCSLFPVKNNVTSSLLFSHSSSIANKDVEIFVF